MVLKEQKLLIFLICNFCTLHGFKEPTTPTSKEAQADFPSESQGGVTQQVAPIPESPCRLEEESQLLNATEAEADFLGTLRRSHQQATLMPNSPFRAEEESPTMPTSIEALILIISRLSCTTYFLITLNSTAYTGIFLISHIELLSPFKPMQLQWLLALFSACTR